MTPTRPRLCEQLESERVLKVVPIVARIDPGKRRRLKEIADAHKATISGVLRICVDRFIDEYEKSQAAGVSQPLGERDPSEAP